MPQAGNILPEILDSFHVLGLGSRLFKLHFVCQICVIEFARLMVRSAYASAEDPTARDVLI